MHPVNVWVDATVATFLRVLCMTGRTWSANDDASSVGIGVGAFNLARRSWLERTRAVECLRMEVADDVALGALMKQSGARTRFLAGKDDAHLVFLDSLGAFKRSSEKGGGMFGFNWWLPILMAVLPVALDLVVPIGAMVAGSTWAMILGGAALLLATTTHLLVAAHFGGPMLGALFWPLGYFVSGWFTFRAGLRAWRNQGVYWRDTFYARGVLEEGRCLNLRTLRVRVRGEVAETRPGN